MPTTYQKLTNLFRRKKESAKDIANRIPEGYIFKRPEKDAPAIENPHQKEENMTPLMKRAMRIDRITGRKKYQPMLNTLRSRLKKIENRDEQKKELRDKFLTQLKKKEESIKKTGKDKLLLTVSERALPASRFIEKYETILTTLLRKKPKQTAKRDKSAKQSKKSLKEHLKQRGPLPADNIEQMIDDQYMAMKLAYKELRSKRAQDTKEANPKMQHSDIIASQQQELDYYAQLKQQETTRGRIFHNSDAPLSIKTSDKDSVWEKEEERDYLTPSLK